MRIIERIFNKKQLEKEQLYAKPQNLELKKERERSVFEKYPDGIPASVLEQIDYSKFGAMLKQEKLLSPSYNKSPSNMRIAYDCGVPKLKLRFRSTTSSSYKTLEIFKYNVFCVSKGSTDFYLNSEMEEIWRKFVEEVMTKWDKGYCVDLLDKKRKEEIGNTLIEDEKLYIESIKGISEWGKKSEESKDL